MPKARRRIAAADAETDPFKHGRIPAPFIWGIYDGSEFHHFDKTAELVEFCEAEEMVVYMHNGGKFDFHFMHEFMEPMEPIKVINGRIASFRIGLCEFRDSYCILPVPLAAHDKGKIDYEIFEQDKRDIPGNRARIVDYLRRDCVSLFHFVHRYVDAFGLNITLASGALKTWKKMSGIKLPKTDAAFYDRFAPFYYGGRVEAIEPGEHSRPLVVADINSAYPYAMLTNHPFGNNVMRATELPEGEERIARAFIRMRAASLGAFPYREKSGALGFPRDGIVREFTITGHEYLAALETGTLENVEVLEVLTLLEKVNFREYVERFYKEKAEAKAADDSAAYLLAKLHLNSLYGKFGANPRKYSEYTICDPADIDAACEYYGYDLADISGRWAVLSKPLDDEKHQYYNVATAASVTGFVRAMLWRAICRADRPIYCDTDSIIADSPGELEIGTELGQWDIEAEGTFAAIAGKKLYAVKTADDWKTASKGVRLDADAICRIARGERVTYKSEAPTFSLKSAPRFIERTIAITG